METTPTTIHDEPERPGGAFGDPNLSFSVLIVDDEEIVREMLDQWLTTTCGLETAVAENGEIALQALEKRLYDVVLTDLRMPEVDGLELLKSIKSRWPHLPVIIISGNAEIDDTIEALRAGAVDFLQKPFQLTKVTEAISRVYRLKRIETSRKEALRFLKSERRVFEIPNDVDLCPVITNEVTKDLTDKGITDIAFLEGVRVALNEMLFNAIEHGNLGITFEEKSEFIENHTDYAALIRDRSRRNEGKGAMVRLDYQFVGEEVQFTITDQGDGFDHSSLPDPTDPANLLSAHGRGILMTRIYMDEVIYNDKGNQVTLIKRRQSEEED